MEMRTVFVTVTYPPPWTIPHPDPPPDQEASSSTTFHRKWHSPGLAPGTFSLDTQDTLAVSGACVGRLRQSSQVLLPRTILAPGHVSALPSPPSPWSPLDPREPSSQESIRGGPVSPFRHRGGASSPQEPGGDPLFSTSRPWQSLRLLVPTS